MNSKELLLKMIEDLEVEKDNITIQNKKTLIIKSSDLLMYIQMASELAETIIERDEIIKKLETTKPKEKIVTKIAYKRSK